MWKSDNRTPYAVGHSWNQNQHGVHQWLVAVRATFDISRDGRLSLADEQLEPLLSPEYHGANGTSSLRYDTDLTAVKPTTDIIVNGTAYAPQDRPATTFAVALRAHTLRKELRVFGKRYWWRAMSGLTPSAPEPVTQVPLRYELAYGGLDCTAPDPARQRVDLRNPVGRGVTAEPLRLEGYPAHQLECSHGDYRKTGPAGFGAIASHWSPRLQLPSPYAEAAQGDRIPVLPLECNPMYSQCAPVDQRPERALRGGELVELWNLTPAGILRFTLPRLSFTCTTHFVTPNKRRTEEHRGRLSTVIIEPDIGRLSLVWQSGLLVHQDEDCLERTVVKEERCL